jgi:hypothetical protein
MGQAPDWVAPWIAPGLLHAQMGLRQASLGCSPRGLHYRAFGQMPRASFLRYMVAATPQMRLVWSCKTTSPEYKHGTQDYKPR